MAGRARIHYRRLSRENGYFPDFTLSDRIATALNTPMQDGSLVRQRAAHRLADVPGQPDFKRALNNFSIDEDEVFGTTCLFAPGKQQALLKLLEESKDELTLQQFIDAFEIAESPAPAGCEFLSGLTYWLAKGDHFYQIQHVSLQSGAMEDYLTWLLREKTSAIAPGHRVILQSVFDQSQMGDEDLKFIQIGGVVPDTLQVAPGKDEPAVQFVEIDERKSIGDEIVGFAKGKNILEELFGEMEAKAILEAVPAEAALEVSVNIGYRSRKRKFTRKFMSDLATNLRNLPDGEVTVRGKNGVAVGQDARIFQDMPVKRLSNTSSLFDLDHVREQMQEVHRRFLLDGKIEE